MNRKKIIFLCNTSLTLESFLIEHIKSFSIKKYDIYVISNFNDNLNKFKNIKAKLINLPFNRQINIISDLFCLFKLIHIFIYLNPHMIISITPKAGFISSLAAFLLNVKIRIHIFTGQVWANKKNFFLRSFLLNLDKVIASLSTNLIIDGNSQKKFLIKNRVIKNIKKTKVILNGSICGVDTTLFKKNNTKKNIIRKKLNIDKNSVVLIYVGRINKEKGILKLIKVFSNLYKKNKNLFLLIVGTDELRIKNILSDYSDLKYKIKTIKHSKNIQNYLQASDIFCFPSEREGFGLSLIEASSCELPVVCTDIYGLKDTMINNVTGYRYDINRNSEFLFYLNKLILRPKLRLKLGKKGRKFVKDKFEKKNVVSEFNKYFEKILSLNT